MAGLENAGIGLDPHQEKDEKPFIDVILDDIQKGNDQIYPPYLQMDAETLCKGVDQSSPIITKQEYSELGGSELRRKSLSENSRF